MERHRLTLIPVPGTFAICRLPAASAIPPWATRGPLFSITRTADELSVVCADADAPPDVQCTRGFAAFRLAGTFDLQTATGILASVAIPLADARLAIFAVSTYDTDYVLTPGATRDAAIAALTAAGHQVKS